MMNLYRISDEWTFTLASNILPPVLVLKYIIFVFICSLHKIRKSTHMADKVKSKPHPLNHMVNGPGQFPLTRHEHLSTTSCHISVACVHYHIMGFLRVEMLLSCVCHRYLVIWLGDLLT